MFAHFNQMNISQIALRPHNVIMRSELAVLEWVEVWGDSEDVVYPGIGVFVDLHRDELKALEDLPSLMVIEKRSRWNFDDPYLDQFFHETVTSVPS